jgi:carboxymethylenebutenolidase
MSERTTLHASDGQALGAYVARPDGEPIAALVVVQEIFGVNAHIRSVADAYAKDGFLAVAPALFDRIEPDVELGYEGADAQTARSFIPKLSMEKALADVAAAVDYCTATGKKVGVIGYCLGGTLAWLSACRLPIAAAVGYYGGRIAQYAAESPKAPIMLHYGRRDKHIPPEEIERVQSAHPCVEIFTYDAGHGFNCEARADYDPASAQKARARSLTFLKEHLT